MSGRITKGATIVYSAISFISGMVICLPRYSGVRPTMSPATKTPIRAIMIMLYRPVPSPPKTISPSSMLTSGTAPPSGV